MLILKIECYLKICLFLDIYLYFKCNKTKIHYKSYLNFMYYLYYIKYI